MSLDKLQLDLNIKFNNIDLLESAITHKSFYSNKKVKIQDYNQRLEYLGDSVLDLIVSEYLFNKYQEDNEGILTTKRSILVNESSLSNLSKRINLNKYLRMSGDEISRLGNMRDSALADALEALIGAIFIDKGYIFTKNYVLDLLKESLENISELENFKDPKSTLQEIVQAESLDPPKYNLVSKTGPPHNPIFKMDLYINNFKVTSSEGNKKIISEQKAAEKAIAYIKKNQFVQIKAKKSIFKKVIDKFR